VESNKFKVFRRVFLNMIYKTHEIKNPQSVLNLRVKLTN